MMKTSERNKYIALAVICLLLLNLSAQNGPGFVTLVSNIMYFYTLYKISVLSGESGWFAVFGILNFVGLIFVLLIPQFKVAQKKNQ